MDININLTDAALQQAYRHWQEPLAQGHALWQAGRLRAAEAAFHEAVRISASYHPLFHFFESGLNTELALTLYALGDNAPLQSVVERALFQDHFNPVMLSFAQWLKGEITEPVITPYDIWGLSSPLFDGDGSALKAAFLHAQHLQGEEKVHALRATIRECEVNHGAFHRLSAEPYTVRAKFFLARNDIFLAQNDVVKGLNLAPKWSKLLEMQEVIKETLKMA